MAVVALVPSFLALLRSFRHLLSPLSCLHCGDLSSLERHLCSVCQDHLALLDPAERCIACFRERDRKGRDWCQQCHENPPILMGMAAAFPYWGPAQTMVQRLKFHGEVYLARGMSGFLALQWDRLGWPFPDAIVPVPLPWTRWLQRGYNQSEELAKELGLLLGCPVEKALIRSAGSPQQSLLNREGRKQLKQGEFQCKKGSKGKNQTLLLIDDVFTTGMTLHRCTQALWEQDPKAIYGLTFCM